MAMCALQYVLQFVAAFSLSDWDFHTHTMPFDIDKLIKTSTYGMKYYVMKG